MPTLHSFTYLSFHYLPNKLLGLLSPILPPFSGYLLHLICGGMGCYVLLKRRGVSFSAALLGGVGFMMMPYFNTMLVHGHGSQMMSLAYLPWVDWALLRLYERTTLLSAGLRTGPLCHPVAAPDITLSLSMQLCQAPCNSNSH